VEVAYRTESTMGRDRTAAAAAASRDGPGQMVSVSARFASHEDQRRLNGFIRPSNLPQQEVICGPARQ